MPLSIPPDCNSSSSAPQSLSVRHICDIEPQPTEHQWLVQSLWLTSGVGILGGAPKTCKTYLAAELSLAVATGSAALGRFAISHPGPVLFFGAEDSLPALRSRFEGLAAARSIQLSQTPLFLIDTPVLRLDLPDDLSRLRSSIERFAPRLLVLDPFVRLTAIDENSAAEVSSVLASLRALQRTYQLAILVVHHARKAAASHPNQALRGSSDFAAWSDTNLYLSRKQKRLSLYIEHRSAPCPDPLTLHLKDNPAAHLCIVDDQPDLNNDTPADSGSLHTQIAQSLRHANRPMPTVELAALLHKRKFDVVQTLHQMLALGHVQRDSRGWTVITSD